MKHFLAILIMITSPIWFLPVGIGAILWYALYDMYKATLEMLEHYGIK